MEMKGNRIKAFMKMPGHSFTGMTPGTFRKNAITTATVLGTGLRRGNRENVL